ncbi:MAG TPA: glycosyltransferase family 39 protein [Patescibacteria group bacterium]
MHSVNEEFSFKNLFFPLTSLKAVHYIILIGIIVLFFGIFNGFVGDDQIQIVKNPAVSSLSNWPYLLTGGTFFSQQSKLGGFSYKPFLNLSYALSYFVGSGSPFSFHLIQIIVFIINSIFVFFIFRRFFGIYLSIFLSLIFLTHPINSESAFYIADMQEVLFFFFGSLAFLILLKYKSIKALVFISLLLLFSLLSKESGVLFVFISLFYIFLFERRIFLKFLGFILIISGLYLALRIYSIGLFNNNILTSSISSLNIWGRLINIPSIVFFYLKTFFYPINLAMSYQWVIRSITFYSFFLPLVIDLIFLSSVLFLGIYLKKIKSKVFKEYLFFAFWFGVGISLHLQLIPLDQTVSDRWFYFPIVGLLGMIGILVSAVKFKNNHILIFLLAMSLIISLSFRTFIRSFDWKDSLSIASSDIKVSKEAFGIENELSSAYIQLKDFKEAKLHAQKSIDIRPTQTSYIDLGVADTFLGEYDSAYKAYKNSLKFGDYYVAYENLAALSIVYGNPAENISYIKNISLKKFPNDAKLWLYLAILEYRNNLVKDAKYDIKKAYLISGSSSIIPVYNAITNGEKVNTFFNVSK